MSIYLQATVVSRRARKSVCVNWWSDTLTWFEWTGMAVIIAAGILAMRVEKKEQVPQAKLEA